MRTYKKTGLSTRMLNSPIGCPLRCFYFTHSAMRVRAKKKYTAKPTQLVSNTTTMAIIFLIMSPLSLKISNAAMMASTKPTM